MEHSGISLLFWFAFLAWEMMWNTFSYNLCIFFDELFVQIFLPFFTTKMFVFLLLSFKSPLYILESSPLLDVTNKYFVNIFSCSVTCPLISLSLSFDHLYFLPRFRYKNGQTGVEK